MGGLLADTPLAAYPAARPAQLDLADLVLRHLGRVSSGWTRRGHTGQLARGVTELTDPDEGEAAMVRARRPRARACWRRS
jgi:hypothetical protein